VQLITDGDFPVEGQDRAGVQDSRAGAGTGSSLDLHRHPGPQQPIQGSLGALAHAVVQRRVKLGEHRHRPEHAQAMGERRLCNDVGQRHRCFQRRVLVGHGQR
jgi:hypothetical protein